MAGAHGVPAVHTVHGDFDLVTPITEQLALQLAHRERIVDDEHALVGFFGAHGRIATYLAEAADGHQFIDRTDHVFDIDDQHWGTVLHQCTGANVFDFAEPRVERLHDQFTFAEKPVDEQPVSIV